MRDAQSYEEALEQRYAELEAEVQRLCRELERADAMAKRFRSLAMEFYIEPSPPSPELLGTH